MKATAIIDGNPVEIDLSEPAPQGQGFFHTNIGRWNEVAGQMGWIPPVPVVPEQRPQMMHDLAEITFDGTSDKGRVTQVWEGATVWARGINHPLAQFTEEQGRAVEAAARYLREYLQIEPTATMKEAISHAAIETGCQREDLCTYLLALGIGAIP